MNLNSPHPSTGFSLQEMLVVISIIGITTLIVLPGISNLTAKAETASARRNAQLLSSVTAAARASGDPAFKSLSSKPALIAFFGSGGYSPNGDGHPKIGVGGLTKEDAWEAARYLTYNQTSGGLAFTGGSRVNPISDAPESGGGGGGGEDEGDAEDDQHRWNAQLLEGAASMATARGDNSIALAGSKGTAISYLVDGGVGGPMVAGMSSDEQSGAATYLNYTGGTLRYTD